MPEHTNNVSSGLSPILKTATSGRADLTANAENATRKGAGFSSDLDKARQQQFDKAGAELAPRGSRREGSQASASEVKNTLSAASSGLESRSVESRLLNDSLSDATGEIDVIGKPIPKRIEIDDSSNSLLSATNQPLTDETNQSIALANDLTTSLSSLTTVPTEKATPTAGSTATPDLPTATPRAAPTAAPTVAPTVAPGLPAAAPTATPVFATELPTAATTTTAGLPPEFPTASKTNTADPVSSSVVVAQLPEQQSAKPTPVAPHEAVELQMSGKSTGALSGTVGEVVTLATLAGRSTQLTRGLDATKADDGVVAPPVLSTEEGLDVDAGRLLKEQPFDVTVSKTPIEHSAVMTNAATLSKGRATVSGKGMSAAVTTAPETLITGQAEKASVAQKSAVELTQLASANGIVTQATLAGRFQQLSREVSAPGAKTPQAAVPAGLTQAVLPGLSAVVTERVAVGDMPAPLVNDSLSAMESLMGVTEANPTVQQRIAATEAMLSQMAQEAGNVAVKVPTADNLLATVAGGTVSTPAVQHSESAAGPIVQAPLNINLTSADAETALAGNVKWMTNEGVKNAVMTVTPHGMGPISVKIGIDGDQMDVSIIASQHSTRDALESMLPRLREQLAVQGHETVKVDVSDGKNEQSRSGNGQTFAESRNPAGASSQDNPSNSSNHDDKTEYGRSDGSELVSESLMAEDLQRVAARAIGEAGSRPVFDAYV